ncbi:MAG: Fatty acid desaturase [Phycisphaerales bacterium]|nr:Fatty acid desaturase [Phycisphaerales bacterium]
MLRTSPLARYPIPTVSNAAIVLGQLLALSACFVVAGRVHGGWKVAGLAIAFGILMNSVYSAIHEAEHGMLFPDRRANEAAGIAMALFFPAPFHLLRQGHIGHHLRNRSDDEAFDLYFDGDNVVWKWMVWLGILTGLYYLLVVVSNVVAAICPFILDRRHFKIDRHMSVDRASAAFLHSFNPIHLRWIRMEGIAAISLHVLIVWRLQIPPANYLAMYATFGFMWSAMQYVHHYGTERHVTRGARNLWIFGPVDAFWLNHNWHQAHHEHPTVPWVYLPRIAGEPSRQRGFLPWMYLRMWRGPRRTGEHVENKYAGRIIQ